MSKILVPIATGFEEIETVTIIDICRRANIEVVLASLNDIAITGANSITIHANMLLDDVDVSQFDMIVLPGGADNAQTLSQSKKLISILQVMKKENKYIAAICASPYALDCAEVLNENFTCYPSFEKKIKQQGYKENEDIVIDKKVITSRGPATAMVFALELVKILCGDNIYKSVKASILFNE